MRLRWISPILFCGMAWAAAPTVDNVGQIGVTQSFPQSISNFVVGAGSNGLLFCGASYFSTTAISVSSAVFNGSENLVHLDTNQTSHGANFETTEIWYLKLPSNTTANVTFTYSATPSEAVIGCTSWFGVDQTTPFGTVAKNNTDNTSTAPTVTVSSGSNAVVHDVVSADEFPGALTATGTQRWYGHSGVNGTAGGGQSKAGGASIVMNWTLSHAGQTWSIMGVGINGVSAAAMGPTVRVVSQ